MAKVKNALKTASKTKGFKAWLIVSSVLMVILIVATIVATSHPLIYGTINSKFGGERRVLKKGDPNQYMRYTTEYTSKDEVLNAANSFNERLNEEGIILLKNEDNVLPLNTSQKITVFGRNSIDLVLGGSGSSLGTGSTAGAATLYSSLTDAGFSYNPKMKDAYAASGISRADTPTMGSILTGYPVAEVPKSFYNDTLRSSYVEYSDAALVVISRIGGEGYDLPRSMFWDGNKYNNPAFNGNKIIPGARSVTDHYLQLDQNETDTLKEACDNFDNVILIINCSTSMELGFLNDPGHYAYNSNIKGALWVGNPGMTGINALGRVLNGSVNPSGKTVDLYARDFKADPTWNNFANNLEANGNRYTVNGQNRNAYFVEYEEGIYTGYKYYETRGFDEGLNTPYTGTINNTDTKAWDNWYDSQVVFPFGYGLSYSSFDWQVSDWKLEEDVISVNVIVTNTGNVAGKDVIQLYYTAPYINGEIEKAHVVLGDFIKTDLLPAKAGADSTKTYTLSLKVSDMTSYDYNDANGNGFKGFELDGGDYEVKVMRDSHTVEDSATFNLSAKQYPGSNNLFDEVSDYIDNRSGYMSRSDFEGTWPTKPIVIDREVTADFISSLNYDPTDKTTDPWYSSVSPTQSTKPVSHKTSIKLHELIGKSYDDPLWEEFMNQLTVAQMRKLVNTGNFNTTFIQNIDKPLTIDADGPMGFAIFMGDPSVYNTCYYASECVIAATWNIELARGMGEMVGDEALIGYERGDGRPYSGWYAPAVNLHRSQFGGRNFEYYSEDGLLSGKLAAEVVKGAKSKGVYTYLKHFALNDQETNRETNGVLTWANEQSMRENYFVPFEIAVKEGGATAMMSSFNRIGTVWAGGNYKLLTELLRDEWGFKGMVITDFNVNNFMHINQMVRAGGDISLSADKRWDFDNSNTSVSVTRKAAKNILYTVANSNAMNGYGEGVVYVYAAPTWVIVLGVSVAGVCVFLCGLGIMIVALSVQKQKKQLNKLN